MGQKTYRNRLFPDSQFVDGVTPGVLSSAEARVTNSNNIQKNGSAEESTPGVYVLCICSMCLAGQYFTNPKCKERVTDQCQDRPSTLQHVE